MTRLSLSDLSDLSAIEGRKKYLRHRCSEQQIQRAVLEHLKLRHAPGIYWFHVANDGYRAPIEAKSLGVMIGTPFLTFLTFLAPVPRKKATG